MILHTIPVGSIGTNCYMIASEKGSCAVVDPGAQPAKLLDYLENKKLTCKAILLTHGHYDHIGAVRQIMEQYPGALVYIGEKDASCLTDTQESLAVFRDGKDEDYLISPSQSVTEGDEIIVDDLVFRVYDTPGHTKGGVSYICDNILLSGDTLFRDNVGRCDLPGGDYATLLNSLKKLSALPGDYTVCPGHGPVSTLDYERRSNLYMHQAHTND